MDTTGRQGEREGHLARVCRAREAAGCMAGGGARDGD